MSVLIAIIMTSVSEESTVLIVSSVSCVSPVSPCSAADRRRSHTCGGGSSCRLCSGGRASPCFPPGTPRAWLSYLTHTEKSQVQMCRVGEPDSEKRASDDTRRAVGNGKYCSGRSHPFIHRLHTLVPRQSFWSASQRAEGKTCEMTSGAF